MSNIGGNYNFGVWNPPTGLDSLRYSQSLNFELAAKLNNLQIEKEEGIKQDFGVKPLNLHSLDIDLVIYLNDNNRKIFNGMIRQGWGG